MKTQEELKELKQEYEALTAKLKELTEDELKEITGGHHAPMEGMMCTIEDTCSNDPATCGLNRYNNPLSFFDCPKQR